MSVPIKNKDLTFKVKQPCGPRPYIEMDAINDDNASSLRITGFDSEKQTGIIAGLCRYQLTQDRTRRCRATKK